MALETKKSDQLSLIESQIKFIDDSDEENETQEEIITYKPTGWESQSVYDFGTNIIKKENLTRKLFYTVQPERPAKPSRFHRMQKPKSEPVILETPQALVKNNSASIFFKYNPLEYHNFNTIEKI